ncbi:MAG: alpha/beta fold hydrolase [Proteobacteria bacterium]|nr:alpha/beta fold hydrolase [Pseudomonadota bacterium]
MSGVTVTEHRIATPGGSLFARRWTSDQVSVDAPTIVLFHDSLGSVDLWRSFPEMLAKRTGMAVVAYDRLGFGQSDPAGAALTADFIVDEAHVSVPALIEQLGLSQLVSFGHSVGGAMAVATAAMLADRCRAVITESSQAFVEDRTLRGIREAAQAFADPDQVARLARYHGDKAAWVLSAWIDTWQAPWFADWSQDAMLERLRCPLLAMHGSEDEYGSLAHPRRLVKNAAAGGREVIFDGVGHLPHREQPEVVLETVAAFLAG